MILSIVFILLVGAIVFFHYVQGFFSAFLSVVICLVAAAVALGFHEQIVYGPLGGKTGDFATALSLCLLFALTYFILRLIFDACIPGNVSFGVWPDRLGGATMGFIAGMITAGIVAIAAGSLPFAPSMFGYSRWPTETTKVELSNVPPWARYGRGQEITNRLYMTDKLLDPTLSPEKATDMILPVDKFAQGYISMVSAGSLSGDTQWAKIHPDYSAELFLQRLGVQPGAKRTAFPMNGKDQVEVFDIFRGPVGMKQIDAEHREFRVNQTIEIPETLTPSEGKTLLVIRVVLNSEASDKDGKIRFSTASFRLVMGEPGKAPKNFVPIATLENASLVARQHPDDFLFVNSGQGADLVFEVDADLLPEGPEAKLPPGTFLEYKRYSRIPLGDKEPKPASELRPDERTATSILRRYEWPGRPKEQ